jgi:hypothetical protein
MPIAPGNTIAQILSINPNFLYNTGIFKVTIYKCLKLQRKITKITEKIAKERKIMYNIHDGVCNDNFSC